MELWPKAEGGFHSTANDRLSPSQKIEKITKGLHRFEPLSRQQRFSAKWWYGYCHAVVEAAANYCEPQPIDFLMENGETIHFNREELKGVLAYYFSIKSFESLNYLGTRNKFISPSDFHLALTNYVGIKHLMLGMIFGGDQDEIHNHLITGYDTKYLPSQSRDETVVQTTIHYSPELEFSSGDQITTGISKKLTIEYVLKISAGKIVLNEGHWKTSDVPKILWSLPEYKIESDPAVPEQVKKLIISSTRYCQ